MFKHAIMSPELAIAIDDEMFDIEAVAAGAWAPGPYGAGDQLGTYNEVTPEKRAAALATLHGAARLETINLGDVLFNGYPGFADRAYQQQLVISGYAAPTDYEGILKSAEPFGANRVSYHEERVQTTYNIASKVNGLLHCGVGDHLGQHCALLGQFDYWLVSRWQGPIHFLQNSRPLYDQIHNLC